MTANSLCPISLSSWIVEIFLNSNIFGLINQEGAAEALSQFYYPPVCAATISYPLSALREDRLTADGKLFGFGQLHPRSQGVQTLGMLIFIIEPLQNSLTLGLYAAISLEREMMV